MAELTVRVYSVAGSSGLAGSRVKIRLARSRVKLAGTSAGAPAARRVRGVAPRLAGEIFSENSTVRGVTTATLSALSGGVTARTRGARAPRVKSTSCAAKAAGMVKVAAAPSPLAELLASTVPSPAGKVRK